jgi:cephalosporin-C deacetylase-like acetyl esterase
MPLRRFNLPALLSLVAASLGRAAEPAPLPPFTPWDLTALSRVLPPEWVERTGPVRALLYEGEPYKGNKTKVFAYYASPATLGLEREPGKKFPAVLLLPGGNGQPSVQWVQTFARYGFVAMTIDLGGSWQRTPQTPYERLPEGGPPGDDATKFRLPDERDRDTWMYHAVANAILARSILGIVPDVEKEHIGITGSGWGGYLTCLVAAVDPRFQAAVPVFGCGFLEARSFWTPRHFQPMSPEARKKWTQLWDPASYLASARVPMFFITGANNPYYPLDSYMRTYALVPGEKNISVQPKLKHGVLLDSREALIYFNAQLRGGPPPPKIGSAFINDGKLRVEMATQEVLKSAELYYTIGSHSDNATRQWIARPLSIDGPHLRGDAPPADATAWFVSVRDANNLLGSSEVVIK